LVFQRLLRLQRSNRFYNFMLLASSGGPAVPTLLRLWELAQFDDGVAWLGCGDGVDGI